MAHSMRSCENSDGFIAHGHLELACLLPFSWCWLPFGTLVPANLVLLAGSLLACSKRRIASAAACCFARALSAAVCATAVTTDPWLLGSRLPSVRPTWSITMVSLLDAVSTISLSSDVITFVKPIVSPLWIRLAHAFLTIWRK